MLLRATFPRTFPRTYPPRAAVAALPCTRDFWNMGVPCGLYVQLPFEKEVADSEAESKGKVRGKSKGKILELITANPQITVPEIAEIIGLSIAGVEKNIRQLKQEGVISRTSETKSGEWIIN